jgi:hypothetical protein
MDHRRATPLARKVCHATVIGFLVEAEGVGKKPIIVTCPGFPFQVLQGLPARPSILTAQPAVSPVEKRAMLRETQDEVGTMAATGLKRFVHEPLQLPHKAVMASSKAPCLDLSD